MKRLIPLIIGLVLGIGGGTGLYILRGGGADETAAGAEDAATHGDVGDDTTHVAGAESTGSADDGHTEPAPSDVIDPQADEADAIADALLADIRHDPTADDVSADGTDIEAVTNPQAVSTDETPPAGADQASAGGEPATAEATPTSDPATQNAEATGAEAAAGTAVAVGDGAGPSSATDLIGGPVDNEEAAKRVAKIFSQMQARDAARVLSLMERSEVELILKQLDNRSAAKILSGLSPEQAAALSAVLIRGGI